MLRKFQERLYPELALFPTAEGRRSANRRAGRIAFGSARTLLGIPAVIVASISAGYFVMSHFHRYWASLLVPLVTGIVAWIVAVFVIVPRNKIRREFRVCLREQGVRICISCGYSLTGNTSGVCPECGRAAHRRVGA